MRPRCELTAQEVSELHGRLFARLEGFGLETQPEVAMRVLDLVSSPDAGPSDFAEVVQHDAALTGRLLKTANSAYFAQRRAVTSIDRACVVLGLERIRGLSLGFTLSQAATSCANPDLARRTWGVAVFRATLAAELARASDAADLTAEAFVVGMLLDAGLPLMPRLLSESYIPLMDAAPTPAALFKAEFNRLPFTHQDVAAALCSQWRLPELLAKPVEWRHVRPSVDLGRAPLQRLQRVAHIAGAVAADASATPPAGARAASSVRSNASRLLRLDASTVEQVVAAASAEYTVAMTAFGDLAEPPGDMHELTAAAHTQLSELVAEGYEHELWEESAPKPTRFWFDGFEVEVASSERAGEAIAILRSAEERLAEHRFQLAKETAEGVLDHFGLECHSEAEVERLRGFLSELAA